MIFHCGGDDEDRQELENFQLAIFPLRIQMKSSVLNLLLCAHAVTSFLNSPSTIRHEPRIAFKSDSSNLKKGCAGFRTKLWYNEETGSLSIPPDWRQFRANLVAQERWKEVR